MKRISAFCLEKKTSLKFRYQSSDSRGFNTWEMVSVHMQHSVWTGSVQGSLLFPKIEFSINADLRGWSFL